MYVLCMYVVKEKIRLLTIAFLLLITFGAASVFAQQQPLDLTVSPLFFEYATEKGAKLTDKIRVRNNTAAPISLQVGLQKLAPGANNETTISNLKPEDEFVSWVTLESQVVDAKPQEWTDIPFTINVPETAAFGYYFAFLLTQAPPEKEAGTAKVVGGVGVPVLLNVKAPGAIASGELIEFKPKAFINEYLPVEFIARFSNTGNVHIKPRGNIFVRGAKEDLAILEVNQALGSVLPQAERSFEAAWTEGFLVREPIIEDGKVVKDKKGDIKTKLTIHWNRLTEFRLGRYSGHLLAVYDDGTRDVALEGTTNFWVIPYKVLAGLVIGVVVLVLVIRKLLQVYVAREVRRREGP